MSWYLSSLFLSTVASKLYLINDKFICLSLLLLLLLLIYPLFKVFASYKFDI